MEGVKGLFSYTKIDEGLVYRHGWKTLCILQNLLA